MSVGVAAEIKQKLSLVDVIGESVQLRKAGISFKGLCPFHGEKTPSFTVTPGRETWKCFGCGKGGDLFSFVMERDGIDFPEALRRLAGRAGVELSERTTREDARRKRLRDALEAAIAFYHQVMMASSHGAAARAYLHGRGFTDQTIETFQLGYAPDRWDALARALIGRRGFREDDLEAAGLAVRRPGRRTVYDRFRGRIIFPIRDPSGGATGLGGRILPMPEAEANAIDETAPGARRPGARRDGQGPKYLNTPATPLFDKSRTLYLIDRAKGAIRRTGVAVLVEGNTDALMAHQQGFDNVVGSLGTALTAAQVELLTRYAPRLALAYDVDSAGQNAASFGARELHALMGEIRRSAHRERLTDVDVVRLPTGRDPDEVMRDEPETWRRVVEQAQPIMEYLIDDQASRVDPRTISGRERLVRAVIPIIRAESDPVRRDGYLQLLARRSGVEERVLLEALRRPDGQAASSRKINLDAVLSSPDALNPEAVARTIEPVEAALLRLVLVHPHLQVAIQDQLEPSDLITTPARELWRSILSHRAEMADGAFVRDRFLEDLEPTLQAIARTLYARTDPDVANERLAIDQCLLALERRRLEEQIGFLRASVAEEEAAGQRDDALRLLADVRALEQRRAELDRRQASTTVLHQRRRSNQRPATAPTPTGGPI